MIIDKNNIVHFLTKALEFYNNEEYIKAEYTYSLILKNVNFLFPELYLGYANTLISLKKYELAIINFKKFLSHYKQSHEAYFGIAIAFEKLHKIDKAIKYYKKTINYKSNFLPAYNNLGNLYQKIFKYKKAKKIYFKALNFDDHQSKLLDNIGSLYQYTNQYRKAASFHKLAMKDNPRNHMAYFNYSLALLMLGKIEKGFMHYEYRLKLFNSFANNQPIHKKWKGNEIKDKILFIFTEQGFGDSIQFIRYITYIKKISRATILFKCQNKLLSLFKNIKEIDIFIQGNHLPNFDYYLPLLSTVHILNNKLSYIPNQTPYLSYSKKENIVINNKHILKVGITWKGSHTNSNNESRSISLLELDPLLNIQGCQFYSLQKDYVNEKELSEHNIIDLKEELNNFNDTANLIDDLDLIISIDTAVAHLALSLKKETWVLLSHVSDYRWSKKYSNAIWYPHAKIYKQNQHNNKWGFVIKKMRKDLLNKIELF